ncbi:MAG: helix-turn-helix domain-containing protein [Pseudomonadota bacterium]
MANNGKQYLTVKEAIKHTGLSRATLHRAFQRGDLARIKIGVATRYDVDDLDAYMVGFKETVA